MKIATMECKLCLEERDLKDSHIISEFWYKPLYDEKHRFHVLTTTPEDKNIFAQKGIREKLLCYNCEQYFSRLEDYVRKVFYGGVGILIKNDKNKILINGIDYTKFKLFQLSLLWRASVSHHKFFSEISLGPHEEKLRRMLISKKPGEPYDYGCILVGLLMDGSKLMHEMVMQPEPLRIKDYRWYRFVLGGYTWLFIVSSHSKNFFYKKMGILLFIYNQQKMLDLLLD